MFLGEYQHSMDEKGRVVLPRKFRDDLLAGCVVTQGQENCLYVFSKDQWQIETDRVSRLPRTNRRARNYARSFFSGASEQMPDRQGRVQLTEKQRRYAGLEGAVTVVGVAERIELWSPESWEAVAAEADGDFARIEEELSAGEGI